MSATVRSLPRSRARVPASSSPLVSVNDLYARVTEQVIQSLEKGVPPWICPWAHSGTTGLSLPVNALTGRPYRGINVLLLNARQAECGFGTHRWLTFNQARSLGCHVRKGATGSLVAFFKMWEADGAANGVPASDDRRVIPLLRAFTVFNAEQVEGLPKPTQDTAAAEPWASLFAAEQLVNATLADVRHGGERAFYQPATDHIQMPERTSFFSREAYYATLLHELTHWTSHTARCNRPLQGRQHLEAYAFEELVAEMGSAFLCGHCGLFPAAGGEAPGLQHAAYIRDWLHALRRDRRLVFSAASLAQKAADFVLNMAAPSPTEAA